MNSSRLIACLAACAALLPTAVMAQNVNVTSSSAEAEPYTLIYPEGMVVSGGEGQPVIINHPDIPLQCELSIVPVEDAAWTADSALASLDDAGVAAGWSENFPGFTLGTKAVAAYQSGPALVYDGQSLGSPSGSPLAIVHSEAVDTGRGYVLDCFYAPTAAPVLRPVVDFIIANFSTRPDAQCCQGTIPELPTAPPTP